METAKLLFELLQAEADGKVVKTELHSEDDFKELYQIAKAHDLMYCVADALHKAGALPENSVAYDKYLKAMLTSATRTIRVNEAFKLICDVFNESKIPFVPLKGVRIRSLYPDINMRPSCDIDILVKKEDLERAITALTNKDFTFDDKRNYHDVSLYYFRFVHLELHFGICENMKDIDALLERVWEFTEPVSQYQYHETPEFFAYHHIAHMKYHFISGGCGIRPFLDLYVMRKKQFYNENKLLELLDEVGLTPFYKAVTDVIAVWFEGAEHTEVTKKCEEYILGGGAYGTVDNGFAVQSSLRNSRIKNAWHTIFPKYSSMCVLYPTLYKRKALLPLYYVLRLFAKTFKKSAKGSRKKLKRILSQKREQISSVGELLVAMGLKDGEL